MPRLPEEGEVIMSEDTIDLMCRELEEANKWKDNFEHDAAKSKAELSASQDREAALREKLEAMTVERDLYASDAKRCWAHMPELADSDADYELHEAVHTLKQRAEAAEARIKASQGQEPVATIANIKGLVAELNLGGMADLAMLTGRCIELSVGDKLYKHPPIPPELAELQRENAELREAFELVKKLHIKATTECVELRKLLEESKVPEVLLKRCYDYISATNRDIDFDMDGCLASLHADVYIYLWDTGILSPQPKEPKQ